MSAHRWAVLPFGVSAVLLAMFSIAPCCGYMSTSLKNPTYLSDTMLRDLFDQSLIGKHYLLDGAAGVGPAADEAAYIDPLDEMPQRLAMLMRATNGNGRNAVGQGIDAAAVAAAKDLQAEQMDYDSLLMDGNTRPSLRDQEYAHQSSLWGHHFMSGGDGEGVHRQHRRLYDTDDISDGPAGTAALVGGGIHDADTNAVLREHAAAAAAAAVAAASFRNSQLPRIKSDATLPAYCNPPNPCPVGYTPESGCQTDFENTAAFSRDYQAAQECMCDNEHMFMCLQESKRQVGGGGGSGGEDFDQYLKREFLQELPAQHKNLVAKKGGGTMRSAAKTVNPYLEGEKLPVAAKKGIRAH